MPINPLLNLLITRTFKAMGKVKVDLKCTQKMSWKVSPSSFSWELNKKEACSEFSTGYYIIFPLMITK